MRRFLMEYFSLTRSETRVFLVVSLLLLSSLLFRIVSGYRSYMQPTADDELLAEIHQVIHDMKSVNNKQFPLLTKKNPDAEKSAVKNLSFIPFDPNTVDSITLSMMGLRVNIIRNILRYRKAGGAFKMKEDILRIYGMNDSIFNVLKDYIFIEQVVDPLMAENESVILEIQKIRKSIEINFADSASLTEISGIFPALAGRIIKYRNMLGGFFSTDQLLEVYGIDSTRHLKIEAVIDIDLTGIVKTNINEAQEFIMSRHPYISRQLAREIIKYREISRKINSMDDLVSAGIIDTVECNKLVHYFRFR